MTHIGHFSVTRIGHGNHFSVMRNGHGNQMSGTIITRMMKKRLNLRMNLRFVKIGTICCDPVNILHNIGVKTNSGETIPLIS